MEKMKKMKNYMIKFILMISLLLLGGCQNTKMNANSMQEYKTSCFKITSYDYSVSVPSSDRVDASYYDDAIFVGDSRMGSLDLYGSYDNQEVYYIEGLFLNKVSITQLPDGDTILDKINASNKHNLYLMFGLNELGWNDYQLFVDQYDAFIKQIKQNKPDMNIYVFLLYTPDHTSTFSSDEIVDVVYEDNIMLKKMCYDNQVYCLDIEPYFALNSSKIDDSLAFDGIHFNVDGVKLFEEFIEYHVVKENDYVKEVCN